MNYSLGNKEIKKDFLDLPPDPDFFTYFILFTKFRAKMFFRMNPADLQTDASSTSFRREVEQPGAAHRDRK